MFHLVKGKPKVLKWKEAANQSLGKLRNSVNKAINGKQIQATVPTDTGYNAQFKVTEAWIRGYSAFQPTDLNYSHHLMYESVNV